MGGGYTTGRPKHNFKRRAPGSIKHIVDPFHAKHIGDFVRVGDLSQSAVCHGRPGELIGDQHSAFDMDMGIDESWHGGHALSVDCH